MDTESELVFCLSLMLLCSHALLDCGQLCFLACCCLYSVAHFGPLPTVGHSLFFFMLCALAFNSRSDDDADTTLKTFEFLGANSSFYIPLNRVCEMNESPTRLNLLRASTTSIRPYHRRRYSGLFYFYLFFSCQYPADERTKLPQSPPGASSSIFPMGENTKQTFNKVYNVYRCVFWSNIRTRSEGFNFQTNRFLILSFFLFYRSLCELLSK